MGLRQTMNENPVVTTVLTVAIMAAAISFIVWRSLNRNNSTSKLPTTAYFSDDDGKTWFIDDAKKVPPFDHNGKSAYIAVLFKCSDGKPFVQRLEGYEPEAKKKIQAAIDSGKPALSAEYLFSNQGKMIKHPGDKAWAEIKEGDPASVTQFNQAGDDGDQGGWARIPPAR